MRVMLRENGYCLKRENLADVVLYNESSVLITGNEKWTWQREAMLPGMMRVSAMQSRQDWNFTVMVKMRMEDQVDL